MTGISFRYLQKPPTPDILDEIFDILATNMRVIAPTEMTYEEDKAQWLSCVPPALEKEARQIILICDRDELIGFFQYYITADRSVFMMEEIQFKPAYHGNGLFGDLYRYLIPRLPANIQAVEAYADKRNKKSLAVLSHLGLTVIGENKNGISYRLRGSYAELKKRYS
ncbi:MAG: GNAT family N-acetyltransferase [Clostridia bacterium]|nr:GNAT family N-acetyltransferase [Clostridia bacterium]